MKKYAVIAVALALPLAISACGNDTSSDQSSDISEATDSSFNDADVMFAQMMIPHHEQAIEMSDIALDPTVGAGAQVLELAQQIKDGQDPEIELMQGYLEAWGQPTSMDSSMDHSEMMSGMLSPQQLTDLAAKRGAEFDTAWLEAMIAHHEGAIQMAEDVIESGENTDVRTLAEKIIADQNAEIATMRELLSAS